MVSSIVKWFIKGDDLTHKVTKNVRGQHIYNLSKKEIDNKVNDLFKIIEPSHNRSTWFSKCFADGKKRAIKSTLKEIFREQKTIATTDFLLRCHKSPKIKLLKQDLITYKDDYNKVTETMNKLNEEVISIAATYEGTLTSEEILVILRNDRKIEDFLFGNQVIEEILVIPIIEEILVIPRNDRKIGDSLFGNQVFYDYQPNPKSQYIKSVAKTLIRYLENETPFKLPENEKEEYREYLLNFTQNKNTQMPTILAADVKRNLLTRLTSAEIKILTRLTSVSQSSDLSSTPNVRPSASEYIIESIEKRNNYTQEEQRTIDKLVTIIKDNPLFKLKTEILEYNIASGNKKVLANFTDNDIQLLNQLFGTQIKK